MKPVPALIAALLLTFGLGSVHAFSVLIEPLEARFGASRADVSLIYSIALISLTIAVLFGHKIYHRLTPPMMAAGACLCWPPPGWSWPVWRRRSCSSIWDTA